MLLAEDHPGGEIDVQLGKKPLNSFFLFSKKKETVYFSQLCFLLPPVLPPDVDQERLAGRRAVSHLVRHPERRNFPSNHF